MPESADRLAVGRNELEVAFGGSDRHDVALISDVPVFRVTEMRRHCGARRPGREGRLFAGKGGALAEGASRS